MSEVNWKCFQRQNTQSITVDSKQVSFSWLKLVNASRFPQTLID